MYVAKVWLGGSCRGGNSEKIPGADPMPDTGGSKMDPPQDTAQPVSQAGDASVTTQPRKGKTTAQEEGKQTKGVRNSRGNTHKSEKKKREEVLQPPE